MALGIAYIRCTYCAHDACIHLILNQLEKMKINNLLIILVLLQIRLIGQESMQTNKISIGETFEIQSSILNEKRMIYVYVPQSVWGMDKITSNLPVIYVLDGESQFNQTAATVDFLSIATNGNDFIPRSIVVGIPNTNRTRDLTPRKDEKFEMSGGGPHFLDFITKELIPYIDSTYQTANHSTIIGHSFGGLMTFEALLKKRDSFDNYIAIDPGFGLANQTYLNEVIDTLNQTNLSKENVFFAIANNLPEVVSQNETLTDTSQLIRNFVIPNEKFNKAYEADNWNLNIKIKYYPEENHYSIPHQATYDALRELYKFYSYSGMQNYYHPKYQNRRDLVQNLKEHYKQISKRLGYQIKPMQGYLNSFAYGLNHFDREDLAIDLLRYNIELYPEDPILYNNLGYFYMSNGYIEKAIEIYTKSLELKEDEWVAKTISELKKMTEDNK